MMTITFELIYQCMTIFFNFPPTLSHLHPLQVENCDSSTGLNKSKIWDKKNIILTKLQAFESHVLSSANAPLIIMFNFKTKNRFEKRDNCHNFGISNGTIFRPYIDKLTVKQMKNEVAICTAVL